MIHDLGLGVAQKNDASQAEELEPYFDFAITESCFKDEWCSDMLPFTNNNKAVLACEYTYTPAEFQAGPCSSATYSNFSFLLKDIELDALPFTQCA